MAKCEFEKKNREKPFLKTHNGILTVSLLSSTMLISGLGLTKISETEQVDTTYNPNSSPETFVLPSDQWSSNFTPPPHDSKPIREIENVIPLEVENIIKEKDTSIEPKIEVLNFGDEKNPYKLFFASGTTVIAMDKDKKEKQIIIWVSLPGNISEKEPYIEHVEGGGPEIQAEKYSGLTVGFLLKNDCFIGNNSFVPDVIGVGIDDIEKYVKIGDKIGGIEADLSLDKYTVSSEMQVKQNLETLAAIESNLGQSYSISNRNFIFSSNGLILNNTP